MFKEVLKSLSDTEICAIATEINNPNITNESIISQARETNDRISSKKSIPFYMHKS